MTRPSTPPLVFAAALVLASAACTQSTPAPAGGAPAAVAPKTPPPPVPPSVDIQLNYSKDSAGNCIGALAVPAQYKVEAMWLTKVNWIVNNVSCPTTGAYAFDNMKACVAFSNHEKIAKNGKTLHCADGSGKIVLEVTDKMDDVKNHTSHLYSIRYNGVAAADPEIDIECTPCDL